MHLRFGQVRVVAGLFYCIKPAVTAPVLHAALRFGSAEAVALQSGCNAAAGGGAPAGLLLSLVT
jgi:chromate transport protein ChrA